MRSSKKNNKPRGEHWAREEFPAVPDWEAARILLEVARCGSFRAAAQKMRQSVNALRRRVDALEKDLGVPLLIRHVNGVKLTDEGTRIYDAALRMESVSFELLQARNPSEKQVEGEVQLAITEGLGVGWILPNTRVLAQQSQADLEFEMQANAARPASAGSRHFGATGTSQGARPEGHEAGLSAHDVFCLPILYRHPWQSEVTMNSKTTASSSSRMTGDGGKMPIRMPCPVFCRQKIVALRNNVSSAHFWAVVRGAGIGVLPTYVQAIGAGLVPLELGEVIKHEIWLTYRSDAKRIARLRKTIDWIVRSFDPAVFPGSGRFISSRALCGNLKGSR